MDKYFSQQLYYSSLKNERKRKQTDDIELQTEEDCAMKLNNDTYKYSEQQQEKTLEMRHNSKKQQHEKIKKIMYST